MSKRLCSFFLALILFVPLLLPHSTASNVVYVAVNNAMLPITDAMPIRSDGLWYVDYRCFTGGDLGINASYNPDSQTLALYTWDDTLAFDLTAGTATNISTDTTYKRWAFHSNGTIYVPVQFVTSQFQMSYSYISSVNVIRIKSNSTVRDSVFAYIAKDEIPRLIERYESAKAQAESEKNTQSSPSTPSTSDSEEAVTVYLTFDVGTNTDCDAILNTLKRYNARATFFLFGSAIPMHDDSIRKMAVHGHALGITAMGSSSTFLQSVDSMKKDLRITNDRLFDTCYIKSRLVRVPGGSSTLSDEQADALIAGGYRYWDWDLDVSSMSLKRFRNAITAKSDPIVIRFDASERSTKNLASFLTYLNENNYKTETLSVLTSPRNARHDKR